MLIGGIALIVLGIILCFPVAYLLTEGEGLGLIMIMFLLTVIAMTFGAVLIIGYFDPKTAIEYCECCGQAIHN